MNPGIYPGIYPGELFFSPGRMRVKPGQDERRRPRLKQNENSLFRKAGGGSFFEE